MPLPPSRAFPWLIGFGLTLSAVCVAAAVSLTLSARTTARETVLRDMALRADSVSRQIEEDLALFDLALREAVRPRTSGPKAAFSDQPLTARYLGFMNVLNEVGDVVADSRSNVSRPANFAGRDYFLDHQKNPADVLMIGRPFAMAPNQHPSIPLSRRLTGPDGGFAGVVVAGVRLAWLSDVLSAPSPGAPVAMTVRRDDGLILMRSPPDTDSIGRGAGDQAWQSWQRDGISPVQDPSGEVRLFRRINARPLVLELDQDAASVGSGNMLFWPVLALLPGLCVLGLALLAHGTGRRADRIGADARDANEERMRLLANMSHELRTPLTGIIGQAELMAEEGGLSEQQLARLARVTEAGTLMRTVVNRVIELSRPEDQAENLTPIACDLVALVRTCLAMVEGEARRKGLRLTSGIELAVPERLMLARDPVQQVLINLLMNAVKFTSQGTVSLWIAGDARQVRFEVADTGPGIPVGKRRRLFRRYDRLDAAPSGPEGSGLGLSITERFVRQLGGRLGHSENPGGGSVFWVTLPTAEPETSIAPPPREEAAVAAPSPRRLFLLLADDLDLTRTVTGDYLRSAGHVVTEVADGESAVRRVWEQEYDAVLTDMRMPVVDGLEVARRIRALPGRRGRTPIVLVTADLDAIRKSAASETGIDVCLTKPFTHTELLAAVANAAARKPAPNGPASDADALDAAMLNGLRSRLGEAAFSAQVDAAVLRIEQLIGLLQSGCAATDPAVSDAVHDLIGVAGLLGLTALSGSLRRFDIGSDRRESALRDAAEAAALALRRFPAGEGGEAAHQAH